jgi:hypothetical protein
LIVERLRVTGAVARGLEPPGVDAAAVRRGGVGADRGADDGRRAARGLVDPAARAVALVVVDDGVGHGEGAVGAVPDAAAVQGSMAARDGDVGEGRRALGGHVTDVAGAVGQPDVPQGDRRSLIRREDRVDTVGVDRDHAQAVDRQAGDDVRHRFGHRDGARHRERDRVAAAAGGAFARGCPARGVRVGRCDRLVERADAVVRDRVRERAHDDRAGNNGSRGRGAGWEEGTREGEDEDQDGSRGARGHLKALQSGEARAGRVRRARCSISHGRGVKAGATAPAMHLRSARPYEVHSGQVPARFVFQLRAPRQLGNIAPGCLTRCRIVRA